MISVMDQVTKEMLEASKITLGKYNTYMDWHTLLHMNDTDKEAAIAARMELLCACATEHDYLELPARLLIIKKLLLEIEALM